MADVTFFEKPGCQGNQRQKTLLAAAGHTVHARSLKTEVWTAEGLLAFLGRLPVPEWFNRSAPAIKLGHIDPDALDVRQALTLLLENPLLIRRPLMQVGEERMPSLSRCELRLIPGVFIGTMISDLLMCGLSSEVLASRQMKSALGELVIHILLPLIT